MSNFGEIVHSPNRLWIYTAPSAARQVEFTTLEQGLGVPKSLLNKQLKVSIDVEHVTLERRPQPFGRSRTWVGFTPTGRKAYRNHMAALRKIIEED